jgi:hypothetical protein
MRLRLHVDLGDADLDHVAGLDHLVRVLDEAVGELGHMHEAVLMHTDVDEGAEGGDVRHRALQEHADLEVLDVIDAVGKGRGPEFRTRVAAGFFQFSKDVLDRRQAEALVDEHLRVKLLQRRAVAHQRAHVPPAGRDDLLGDAIGFGMHRGRVKRLLAVRNAQEPGALLEGARTKARDLHQLLAAFGTGHWHRDARRSLRRRICRGRRRAREAARRRC